jgi:hypothetical protein
MSDEHTPTLQDIAADPDWWPRNAGAHFRELAHWLRGVAAKFRLPNLQRELLTLAAMSTEPAAFENGWH